MTGIPAAILDHEVIHGEEERQEEVGSFMIFWNHPISNLAFPGGSASKESACSTGVKVKSLSRIRLFATP